MFTKNWLKLLAAVIAENGSITYKSVTGTNNTVNKNSFNTLRIGASNMAEEPYMASLDKMRTAYNEYGGVVIGTGTTPPTADDHTLSGSLISDYSFSVAIQRFNDENGAGVTAIYTITNTGTSDFTVGEIGLIANIGSSVSYTYDGYKALLERTVLDTPLTIPAGGIGQVTYTIRLNYPTA